MAEYQTITRDELKQKIDSGESFILIDVLSEQSYHRAHIPGSINISAHDEDFVDNVKKAAPDTNTEVVVYCASFSCQLSPAAAQKLAEAGYRNVLDFEGGLQDWAAGGYSFEGEAADEMAQRLRDANSS